MKRVAALLAAVAMVAGAWAVRDLLVEDDGGGGASTPTTVRLLCATDLADLCGESGGPGVSVDVEDPGATADRLAKLPEGEDPGFDAWLVDGPWAAMVADDRSFAKAPGEVLAEPSQVLGRSPAVIVVQSARRDALATACGGTVTWTCVGEQAGAFQVGLTPPSRGDGLIPMAEAIGSYFNETNYSATDFEDPAFRKWFDQLIRRSTSGTVQLGSRSAVEAAVGQPGTFNVVGALEAESERLVRGNDSWDTIYPEPMSTADVQLVPRAGLDAEALLDQLGREGMVKRLESQGWRAANGQGDPPIEGPGLPSAGTLNALRDLW